MRFASKTAANAVRVLNKCSAELRPEGPWRWSCVVQNGARLAVAASLEDGFLQLAFRPETTRATAWGLERALKANNTLAGGVKLALDSGSRGLHLRAEIAVLEEQQLMDRFERALDGFHHGIGLLKSSDCEARAGHAAAQYAAGFSANLGELLRESPWGCAERGPNEFSVELDAKSAPPARIRMTESGLDMSVELVRANQAAEPCRQALAVFLLTVSSALRMARAWTATADGQESFGFQVSLPAAPDPEEVNHGLAALSVAWRMCAREASVLLHEAAARCYLAARDLSTTNTTNKPQSEEEN